MESYIVKSIFNGIMGMYFGFIIEQLITIPSKYNGSIILCVGVYGLIKGFFE